MNDKAFALYCAVGMINDNIVAECQSPRYLKRRAIKRGAWITAAVAACLALVVSVAALNTGLLAMILVPQFGGESSTPGTDLDAVQPSALATALKEAELYAQRFDKNELSNYRAGKALIWQSEQSGELYTLPINGYEQTYKLELLLEKKGAEVSAEEAAHISTRLWVSLGDGRVVTPYLKESVGNVGYGTIFDYTAELAPDDEAWVAFIREILL